MVYVILRNGKKLLYNNGGSISSDNGMLKVMTADEKYLVVRIPIDLVERAEFDPPCRITRESTAWRKRM